MELVQRAEQLLAQASSVLGTSVDTRVRVEAYCSFDLANDFSVELREIVDSAEAFEGWPPLGVTSMYIRRKPDPVTGEHNCAPELYFDVKKLVGGMFRGSNRSLLAVEELTEGVESGSPMHGLLTAAHTAAVLDGVEHDWPQQKVTELVDFYRQILAGGGEIRTETTRQKLPDTSWLYIKDVAASGSLPDIEELVLQQQAKLAVARSERPIQYQLERTRQDALESYPRPSSLMEYKARYVKPENLIREDGEIVGISGNILETNALIDAERAAGLRKLQPAILDKIEEGLGMWVVDSLDL